MKSLIKFSILAIFISALSAKPMSFEELKTAPKGIAKDYYIYRLIKEKKATKAQLKQLRSSISRYAGVIKTEFDKRLGALIVPAPSPLCTDVNIQNVFNASPECQDALITPKFLQSLSKTSRAQLAQKFIPISQQMANFITAYDEPEPIIYLANLNDTKSFSRYIATRTNRAEILADDRISGEFISKLLKNYLVKPLINEAVIGKKYPLFAKKLLKIPPSLSSDEEAFLLGLNAILHHNEQLASQFFSRAANSAQFFSDRDRANFWLYLTTDDKSILDHIAASTDINIYSLYAVELGGDASKIEQKDKNAQIGPKIIVPQPDAKRLQNYNNLDPFVWQETKKKIRKMAKDELVKYAEQFYTQETLGEYSFIMHRATDFRSHYFALPFMEDIGTDNINRQALILAIARKESQFIAANISTSYALGLMQFMPFLANHIAKKELNIKDFDQDQMFKPKIAYQFANHHLDYLQKWLTNPIFIAYAYNGGIGFTRRMLQKGELFSPNSQYKKYEPFLSLELVPYAESREYAKHVLANYVIYSSILGSNTTIWESLQTLNVPGAGERFRPLTPSP